MTWGASVQRGARGDGGDLTINTSRLLLSDGAQINASTFGEGNAGNLTVTATESVEAIGTSADGQFASGLLASVESGARGDGGDLSITTARLLVRDGAQISASTFGEGNAGNLTVTATESVEAIGRTADGQFASGLFASVDSGARGDGGDLSITTARLLVGDGATIGASTGGEGNAGDLTVRADELVALNGGSTLRVRVGSEGRGNGGTLRLLTGNLVIREDSDIAVSGLGTGNAGNLIVTADSILLDNQSSLEAEVRAGNQGNIFLTSDTLTLRRGSLITASAFEEATGGNISITTNTLAALENSDISANAQQAFGGRISITAEGIFGTQFRDFPTLESDITASSELGPEFSGTVELLTPDIDPAQGLIQPPPILNAEGLLGQDFCSIVGDSEFIYTGRGGIPPRSLRSAGR
ncbi:MAG: S-layer family protein [Coleofasciculaceae cyanobacterium SM2_3_26]|nr:S-layer family protein [Coleofasciculaceae cyanobacterium SM2_3_26]